MNLIEAVKSGKRFKLPSTVWIGPQISFNVTKDMVLSDLWEIEEEKKCFTESEIRAVLRHTYENRWSGLEPCFTDDAINFIMKKLGF